MKFDKNNYAVEQKKEVYPYKIFQYHSPLYNMSTGFDMIYQENKVFNLKLASKMLDKCIIKPGETFSFWKTLHHADKKLPYKDGLTVTNGELTTVIGGGMCQMSNLLFMLFLHTPLTIVERHGHTKKEFPDTEEDSLVGIDATVAEGWLDLKVKNETQYTFQICISFDKENMIGEIRSLEKIPYTYQIENRNLSYFGENGKVFQGVMVYQNQIDISDNSVVTGEKLYENRCEITYELAKGDYK